MLGRLSAKPAPAKVERKPKKMQQDRINLQTKTNKQINNKKEKEKQSKVSNQETKDLLAKNRETENEASPDSDEAGEKEAMFD